MTFSLPSIVSFEPLSVVASVNKRTQILTSPTQVVWDYKFQASFYVMHAGSVDKLSCRIFSHECQPLDSRLLFACHKERSLVLRDLDVDIRKAQEKHAVEALAFLEKIKIKLIGGLGSEVVELLNISTVEKEFTKDLIDWAQEIVKIFEKEALQARLHQLVIKILGKDLTTHELLEEEIGFQVNLQ